LAWPLVQTAPQTFSSAAGWNIRVYLQSKLWGSGGRLRFIQTTCHDSEKYSGSFDLQSRTNWRPLPPLRRRIFAGFSFAEVLFATIGESGGSGTEQYDLEERKTAEMPWEKRGAVEIRL